MNKAESQAKVCLMCPFSNQKCPNLYKPIIPTNYIDPGNYDPEDMWDCQLYIDRILAGGKVYKNT